MRAIRILLALLLLAPLASKASHIIGGDIQYKYVGDSTGVANQYRVKLVLYRDLTGIGLGRFVRTAATFRRVCRST